jgi:general secretion pathway protein D
VGVNVDVTPKVHGADEVSMQIDIDISSVRDTIDIGGLQQPIIGQSRISHAVRLREGEVTLLGGLIQDTDSRTRSGTAGLASIPLLRHLFSGQSTSRTQSELLIALVPHIVRYPEIGPENIKAVAAGTDAVLKLTYARSEEETRPGEASETRPAEEPKPLIPAKPPIPVPGMPGAAPVSPAETPAPPKPEEAVPAAPPPPPAEPKPEAAPPRETAAPPPAAATRVVFLPATAETQVNGTVVATLQLEAGVDVFSVPIQFRWDPKILRLNDITRGGLFAAGGQQPIFTRNIRNEDGEASVMLSRLPGTQGVSGNGALVVLRFQAVGSGETQVTAPEISLRNSQMQASPVAAPIMRVTVK